MAFMAAENQSGLNRVRSWLLLFVCYPIFIARSSVGSITGDRKTVRWVFCVHKDWFVPTRLQGFQDFFADQIRPRLSCDLIVSGHRTGSCFYPQVGKPSFWLACRPVATLKKYPFFRFKGLVGSHETTEYRMKNFRPFGLRFPKNLKRRFRQLCRGRLLWSLGLGDGCDYLLHPVLGPQLPNSK